LNNEDDDACENPFSVSEHMNEKTVGWENNDVSRRRWFQDLAHTTMTMAAASAAAGMAPLLPSEALAASLPALVATDSSCDPTVTVWQSKNDDRLVYLLGTAHISEISANLATNLVRDVHPNAVFVELDLKRIGGVVKPSLPPTTRTTTNPSTTTIVSTENAPIPQAVIPQFITPMAATTVGATPSQLPQPQQPTTTTTATTLMAYTAATMDVAETTMPAYPALPEPPRGEGLGGWIQRKAFNFASAAVGNALRNMYSNLGKAGFNPGEEFAAAIREGQRIDAKIVLGDQDVEYTLRRLTQALAATDLEKLLSPDAEFERSMNELLPGGPNAMQPELQNYDDPAEFKRELAEFVERLKSRDNVRKIIGKLQDVAPALVQVMLTERDAFMAQGLDTLQQFEVIVAVMGIAHMDGVEKNLRQMGWRQVRPKCPIIK
jgi:uncharacterized protein YbaP (TraB family)